MIFRKNKEKFYLLGVLVLCSIRVSTARPKELNMYYKLWKPLELVRGLRALSVDPLNVFRALEAIKDLDSEEAVDAMHALDVRPVSIYDALDDLGIDPLDAYYALKSWITDPLLHQPGDHYHRVNTSGDPFHPFLYVLYKKHDQHGYRPVFMSSKEVKHELHALQADYRNVLDKDKIRMKEFINRAKQIHNAFEDPARVFNDFFGERHFNEWKRMFPDAFQGLKDIYKNPLGFGLKGKNKVLNESTTYHKEYEHVYKGSESINKAVDTGNDRFSKYNDVNRYEFIEENAYEGEQHGVMSVHHIKIFRDKLRNVYAVINRTEEFVQTGNGEGKRVSATVQTLDPTTYEMYRRSLEQRKRLRKTPPPQPQQPPQQWQPFQTNYPHPLNPQPYPLNIQPHPPNLQPHPPNPQPPNLQPHPPNLQPHPPHPQPYPPNLQPYPPNPQPFHAQYVQPDPTYNPQQYNIPPPGPFQPPGPPPPPQFINQPPKRQVPGHGPQAPPSRRPDFFPQPPAAHQFYPPQSYPQNNIN